MHFRNKPHLKQLQNAGLIGKDQDQISADDFVTNIFSVGDFHTAFDVLRQEMGHHLSYFDQIELTLERAKRTVDAIREQDCDEAHKATDDVEISIDMAYVQASEIGICLDRIGQRLETENNHLNGYFMGETKNYIGIIIDTGGKIERMIATKGSNVVREYEQLVDKIKELCN